MAQKYEQLLLKNQLCFPLYACSRKIVGSYTPYLKPLGLTYTQYVVLMALWEHESLSVGQLGRMQRNCTDWCIFFLTENEAHVTAIVLINEAGLPVGPVTYQKNKKHNIKEELTK